MAQVTDPPTPYLGTINSFSAGHMIRIQGLIPGNAQRFNINLQCGSNVNPRDDVALHMSVRLLEGYVARNSLETGLWGNEQGDGALKIGPGQRFEILVLSDANEYKIAINGQHFATFPHRMSPTRITHVAIDGDVQLGLISQEGGAPDSSHQATAASEQFGHQQQLPSAPPPAQPQYGGYGGPPMGAPAQGGYGYGGTVQGGGYGPPPPPPGHQQQFGFTLPHSTGALFPPPPIYPHLANQHAPYPNQIPSYPPLPQNLKYHPSNPYPKQQGCQFYPYQQQSYGYPGHNPSNSNNSSWTSKIPGGAAVGAMAGGVLPMLGKGGKKMKKSKMKKAMKYGLPIAGAGVGAYALSHAIGGHHWRKGSSSSSSSSSD